MFNLVTLADMNVGDYIRENLIPNWVSFVCQLGALIVMILVIFFVAYKPVRKMLQKRADYVEENIRQAEEAKAQALKNASQSEETIIASKKEAANIIAEAKLAADNNSRAMLEETRLEINKMKSLAEEDIARSKEEAKEEIRQEMVSVALAASEEVLKREVNEKDNARIVKDFIKEMDK
ncbi:MAG: F0F1 ATP synthase subunit B [Bacilli bacterium]|nr:F0F1 ATP synthase subunit B [Bacilli bacterium]